MKQGICAVLLLVIYPLANAGGFGGAAAALGGYEQGRREAEQRDTEAEDRAYLRQQRQYQLEMQQRQQQQQQQQQQGELALFKSSLLNGTVTNCSYETLTGFGFSINSRDACAASVRIDPISMRVWR